MPDPLRVVSTDHEAPIYLGHLKYALSFGTGTPEVRLSPVATLLRSNEGSDREAGSAPDDRAAAPVP